MTIIGELLAKCYVNEDSNRFQPGYEISTRTAISELKSYADKYLGKDNKRGDTYITVDGDKLTIHKGKEEYRFDLVKNKTDKDLVLNIYCPETSQTIAKIKVSGDGTLDEEILDKVVDKLYSLNLK